MGITGSRPAHTGSTTLPLIGTGKFEVGCAEIMVNDGEDGDIGTLATIYYPCCSTSSGVIVVSPLQDLFMYIYCLSNAFQQGNQDLSGLFKSRGYGDATKY